MIHILLFARPVFTEDLYIDLSIMRVARTAHMSIGHWYAASSNERKCDQHVWKVFSCSDWINTNASLHNKINSLTVKEAHNTFV